MKSPPSILDRKKELGPEEEAPFGSGPPAFALFQPPAFVLRSRPKHLWGGSKRWRIERTTSDLYLAFEIEDAVTFQFDALAGQSANNLSAAPRGLKGAKCCLVQSFRPIGRQHAVRGAHDGRHGKDARQRAPYSHPQTSGLRNGHLRCAACP